MKAEDYWISTTDGEVGLFPDIGLMRVILWDASLGGSSVESGKMPVAWEVV